MNPPPPIKPANWPETLEFNPNNAKPPELKDRKGRKFYGFEKDGNWYIYRYHIVFSNSDAKTEYKVSDTSTYNLDYALRGDSEHREEMIILDPTGSMWIKFDSMLIPRDKILMIKQTVVRIDHENHQVH